MRDASAIGMESEQPHGRGARSWRSATGYGTTWSFVYIFFTNGIPFDAPNRSEPCPHS